MNFYSKYVSLCNQKGIAPSAAAEQMGISRNAVSHWKARGNRPTTATVLKVAAYFGVPVSYFDENETKTPEFNLQLFAVAQERVLLDTFRSLDEVGKAKALVYISELAKG